MDRKKKQGTEAITTKIDFSFRRIGRLSNLTELAEMFFPGNRNQQHAFLVIWIRLKWKAEGIAPNLGQMVMSQGVSRRTLARVRAKMRRMGLLEHVTRFDPRHGNREGWVLSENFEKGLGMLVQKMTDFKGHEQSSQEQDEVLLAAARKRRDEARASGEAPE